MDAAWSRAAVHPPALQVPQSLAGKLGRTVDAQGPYCAPLAERPDR
jgi:hypothetical protein